MFKYSFFGEVILPFLPIIIVFAALVLGATYFSAYKESEIYNRIYGTNYSASDFFFASDQINSSTQTVKLTK